MIYPAFVGPIYEFSNRCAWLDMTRDEKGIDMEMSS